MRFTRVGLEAKLQQLCWSSIINVLTVKPGKRRRPDGSSGFLPRLPESLEQLDLLAIDVAQSRKVRPDGIHSRACAISISR